LGMPIKQMYPISLPPELGECTRLRRRLEGIVERETRGCDCSLLSGGIDTTFVVSSHLNPSELTVYTVALPGSTDLEYSKKVVERLGLKRHVVIKPGEEDYLRAVKWVMERLVTIDPVEVSADAVHYISLSRALSDGCSCVLSGDGGDELFLGYSFLFKKSDEELVRWLDRMNRSAWMPTLWVGEQLGLMVKAPLYTLEARRIALETPIRCMLDRSKGVGKLPLRRSLLERGLDFVAYREKTPVTSGSGSQGFLSSLAERYQGSIDNGLARSYLGFDPPGLERSFLGWLMAKWGIRPPPVCSDKEERCPVCGRCLVRGYCRFCGSYFPTRNR
jgi:asparagine synthase (glutamine-hydrolysing)